MFIDSRGDVEGNVAKKLGWSQAVRVLEAMIKCEEVGLCTEDAREPL